jgi:hypothetical protein
LCGLTRSARRDYTSSKRETIGIIRNNVEHSCIFYLSLVFTPINREHGGRRIKRDYLQNPQSRDHLEDLDVNVRIILKLI